MKKLVSILCAVFFMMGAFAQDKINWMKIEEALAQFPTEPKKIVVDVYTDWCGWCKVMDRTTFSDSIIIDYLNKNFYPVKLNAEQKEDIVIGDHTFKFISSGARGYHELAAYLLNGKLGYPSVVFIDEMAAVIHTEQGYIKPKQFDTFIKFFGGDHYKNGTFEEFLSGYVSPVKE